VYTLFNSLVLTGQHKITTWQQQGQNWASYSLYREQAAHQLYIPHTVLNLVVQGEKRMYDGRRVHWLHAGDALLIPAGTLLCSEILRPQQQYSSINLVIPDEMILSELKQKKRQPAACSKALTTLPADLHWHHFTQSLLPYFTPGHPSPGYHDIISRALYLIHKNEPVSAMLTKVVKYSLPDVMEKLCTDLPEVRLLTEIAAMGHMSTATLKRRFREVYHCAPMGWIMEKRLQMAGFLLRTTGQSIPEIAYSIGFEDITHFYRQFRRCFKVTPLQWRHMESDLFSK
jgi:AraC-like DNA-binding protein